ncbi:periplasmic divalent cation tolerance protein [Wolbachia endosymbiont of Drosophila melanogaster]|jgi:periplasmic divalent cation tolerance protein|uniref:Divalent-cation tolerance protein CutA n=1 Tax=Wolbachia endosymbiont of Sergentomyia squamirostris TaxID=3113640 RepID=A0AAT9GD39_9RICK|nr:MULTISPECIES: divalent-cation tolerance protein CutA [Wolbachia]MDE5063353.1 divalent-cation tolerance protein CutA [Wolbachia endosymbiont of Drosophila chauvacae]MDU8940974.1 divalent-cation tolerance protein CutA [Wolbachia endosymbiont of Drosophila malagassya]AAS14515.1 periplasmic divalent cation tolerance protein [Wolbachia endosymbiont of Drosophila melanogaster]EEH12523.1 periplasmic divalent cation tolerance protein [Wolbachia endosymbiont of Muscidifurax uniraptor]MBA8753133.1 di
MNNLVLVYTTFSNFEEAKTVSEELLNEKLIVCVNIFPEVNSLYLWEGKISNSCEVVAIMKSRNDQVDKIVEKIEAMHSYDQPAIAVMPIEKANKSFTNWANSVIDVSSIGV